LLKEVDKMDANNRKKQILQVLAKSVRGMLEQEELDFKKLQEIRMRMGKPLILVYDNQERILPSKTQETYLISKEEIQETLEYVSRYSLYAYEHEMKQGFITIEGGHRVGVMGKAILDGEKVKNLQYISSVNIRMSHEVIGCADRIFPYITKDNQVLHTLVISPPRCGKTTLIRDLVRQISDGNSYVKGCTVGVVDERSEIGGCYMGIPQNELGIRTDVLDCCPKAEGMMMLIRSMAPDVIAVDEIGTTEDIHAIEYAMQCGCKMIASVHGLTISEAQNKPILGRLIKERRFDRYVVLGNDKTPGEIRAIYDERGSLLCRDL
jgi:stage III sporulation protein AA